MRQAKKVTLSAMLSALGTVLLLVGAFVDVLDLSMCAIASLCVVFIYIEVGSPYTWLVWLTTSLLTFIFSPGKTVWMLYLLIFGVYPLLKAYIERLPKMFWLTVKLAYINAIIWVMIFILTYLFKLPFVESDKMWIKIGVYLLMNVAFVAYDMFITVMVRVYLAKLRPRFKNLLK